MSGIWTRLAAAAAFCAGLTGLAAAGGVGERISEICGDCVVEKWASCGAGKFLEGPNFDSAGNLWMVGLNSGEILKATPNGQCSVAKGGINFPGGARFDKQGKLIVTSREGLLSYDTATGEIKKIVTVYGTQVFRGLNDVIVDKAGGIYFTEPNGSHAIRHNGRVFYLPPGENQQLRLIGDTFAFPNGLVLSPDEQTLYIGEFGLNRTMAIPVSNGTVPAAGNPWIFAYYEGGMGPDGMLTDTDGNVYVAHYRAGEVVINDKSGFSVGKIKLPPDAGLGTTNLAIHGGYLYITEAQKNEIFRVKTSKLPAN